MVQIRRQRARKGGLSIACLPGHGTYPNTDAQPRKADATTTKVRRLSSSTYQSLWHGNRKRVIGRTDQSITGLTAGVAIELATEPAWSTEDLARPGRPAPFAYSGPRIHSRNAHIEPVSIKMLHCTIFSLTQEPHRPTSPFVQCSNSLAETSRGEELVPLLGLFL